MPAQKERTLAQVSSMQICRSVIGTAKLGSSLPFMWQFAIKAIELSCRTVDWYYDFRLRFDEILLS